MTSPFEPGTRPWARKTLAKIAANVATLGRGELLVDEKGNVYGGDGSTAFNALKRLLRVGEVVGFSDENSQPNSSDVYAEVTVDSMGRISEGTLADGTKVINKIRASVLTIGSTVIDAAKALITDTDENLQPNSADTYLAATIDSTGRVSEATLTDGTKVFPKVSVDSLKIGTTILSSAAPPSLDFDAGEGAGAYSSVVVDGTGRIGEGSLDETGRIPAWTLSAWANRMGVFGGVDILIVAGQSNATERSSLPAAVAATDPRVLQYNPTTNTIAAAPGSATDWIGNAFGREYVRRNPSRRLLIVPAALGSSGFTTTSVTPPAAGYSYVAGAGTWDRTLTSDPVNLYSQMITKALAARTVARANFDSTSQFLGVLWSQGESDRGTLTESQYATKLDDLIATARTDLGVSDLPFIIGSMTPETISDNTTGTAAIHAALLDTPRRVQRTSFIYGPADSIEHLNSRLHWSPQGQAVRAHQMASVGLYRARLNVATGKPVQPTNTRISRSGTAVTIDWDHAASRVTGYTLETSIDSGATWTAQTLAGPLVNQFTMTVTVGTPIWARLKTTNEIGTTDPTKEAKA